MEVNESKEERIRLRQKRIEAKGASEDLKEGTEEKDAVAEKERGQQAVADSLARLDKKKHEGLEKVTEIRVLTDWRETQRRITEEKLRHERLKRLQEEAVKSGKANAAVESRWAELLDQNMPQELHNEIEAQKSACAEIIRSKDFVIRDFQLQLKSKDEEYVNALKQQATHVQQLLTRMRTEYKALENEYEFQLESIEDAHMTERDELISTNRREIDALFDKRKEMELYYMDKKSEREDQYQREIEDLLVTDAEEYNKLKIKLETDIQTLEQQLEEMRATYQLNTEKLEYNYRVLTERDNENSTTLSQLKRKQNKLKDMLNAVIQKYRETDARDKKKNDELTDEYRRVTKQYRDLQAKFRHFESSDTERYTKLWEMHEEEVNELVSKVIKADEIIHKQQLGLDWRPPNLATMNTPAGLQETRNETLPDSPDEDIKVPGEKLRAVIELLASEAGFLVSEPKFKQALDTLSPQEAEMKHAEALLRALGIRQDKDVAALIDRFFIQNESPSEDFLHSPTKTTSTLIPADDVIQAIQTFVEERRGGNTRPAKQIIRGGPNRTRTKNENLELEEDRLFWNRLADVVSDKTFRVWKQLDSHLEKYNQILSQRAHEITKVQSLQDQNTQLKALLNQYFNSKVNDDLIVPPAHTIQF